jgi:hypothetical protein
MPEQINNLSPADGSILLHRSSSKFAGPTPQTAKVIKVEPAAEAKAEAPQLARQSNEIPKAETANATTTAPKFSRLNNFNSKTETANAAPEVPKATKQKKVIAFGSTTITKPPEPK